MDFSLKKKTSPRGPFARALAVSAAFSLMILISGCTGQTAKLGDNHSAVVAEPISDVKLAEDDFAFPSRPPSLMRGREVFQQSCVKCHAASFWQGAQVKQNMAYNTPIDTYRLLTTGKAPQIVMPTPQRKQIRPAQHPAFRNKLSRDDRWAVIFYARYLAGAGDMATPALKSDTVASIFGGNCAVCHGTKGQADGPLFTAKTGNHELHDGSQLRNFMPPPASFASYSRMYNRTDAQIMKYICEGIYPSAMPAWFGDVNMDKDSGKATYVFDEQLITKLVRHVRSLAYTNDLTPELPEAVNPPAGLPKIADCNLVPMNRPWTQQMRSNGPSRNGTFNTPSADRITGGMILGSPHHSVSVEPVNNTHANMKGGKAE